MGSELRESKVGEAKKFMIWIPILISLGALCFSIYSWHQGNKRQKYFDSTNFNIVQNLWEKNPSYTLYNESVKPLNLPPHPTYMMYIPSKLYMIFPDGSRISSLILLPVSYDMVISQIDSGKTVDDIEKSELPQNFYSKKGARDIRFSDFISKDWGNIKFQLRTYPFLAIATQVEYSYKDNPQKINQQTFITTPFNRIDLTPKEFKDLENYTRNVAYFPQNEMRLDGKKNIYDTTHTYLLTQIQQSFNNAKDDDKAKKEMYILLGVMHDTDEKYPDSKSQDEKFDSSKIGPSELNFNVITKVLLEKGLIPQDPLEPNY